MIGLAVALLLGTPAASRPLSLDDAIAVATRQNAQVRAASADAARAHTLDRQALSLFMPTVEARATYQYNDKQIGFPVPATIGGGEIVVQPWWILNWQVTATQNLALYGPALPLFAQARSATRAASDLSQQASRDVAFAVARAYYAALEADALETVAEQARASSAELLRQTQGKREAGRATEAELLRAKVRVSETEQAASQATRAATEAHAALADLLGDAGPFTLARPPRPAAPPDPTDVPSTLVRRSDVAAAREAVEGAEDARSAAARAWYPTLSVTGMYAGYETSHGDLFGQTPTRYSVLGVATLPIFDGNLKYWQLREKREALAAARAREELATTAAKADVRRARERLEQSREAETLSKERLALAERARDLMSSSYGLGAATQLEVLDAEASRSAAARDASQAELETDVAVLDLRRALGLPLTGASP